MAYLTPRVSPQLLIPCTLGDLARLMKGDAVEHIEEKLRYLLRRKANNADGVTYWLVTLGVDRARKNLIAIARDPESQEEMKLVIDEDTSHIPILADLLAHSKYSKISSPKRLQKGERGKSMQSEFSDYRLNLKLLQFQLFDPFDVLFAGVRYTASGP